jgi:ERCC4-type nuclease
MILIDFRETDLLALSEQRGITAENIQSDSKLVNGDLHLCSTNKIGDHCPILVLERKKISDFKASIVDHRWSEQRCELFHIVRKDTH